MSSTDPQAELNKFLASSPNAQNAMNIVMQYGNGNPEAAFKNYVAQNGLGNLASTIQAQLGLK